MGCSFGTGPWGKGLFSLACLLFWANWGVSSVFPLSPLDPVEALAEILQSQVKDPQARDVQLRARINDFRSLEDYPRALLLDGWRDRDLGSELAAVDRRHRASLQARFEATIRDIFRRGDVSGHLEALKMIGRLENATKVGPGLFPIRNLGPEIAALVQSDPPVVRATAAQVLSRLDLDPAFLVTALAGLLQDPDPTLRTEGARLLISLTTSAHCTPATEGRVRVAGCAAVVPAAAAGLKDDCVEVRRLCAEILARSAAVFETLVSEPTPAEMVDDWAEYQRQTLQEDMILGPLILAIQLHIPMLAQASGDTDTQVRLLARQALERIGGGRLRLRQRAASALGLLAKKGLDPWYAEKGSAEHRARLFTALQEDALLEGLRQAIPALNRGLEDPDPRARRAAIEVLESLGTVASPAVPRLIQALSDRDRFVRWAAARALGRIPTSDPGRVIPHLVRLLNDDDPDLRSVAAASLGRLEPSPQVAGGALLRQSPSHIGKDQTKEASNQRMPLW